MSNKVIKCSCGIINEQLDINNNIKFYCNRCKEYAIIKDPNDNPLGLKDLGKPSGIQNDPEC
tara:strand:- start:276 stop:461 length:186 start_codon:yes stop_codon:yes gene_type:complete